MKLREKPSDLRDALDVSAGSLGLTVRQLEKDYWVTEVLRTLAARHRTSVLFKGGTSLSKGWRIIRRFSEDIDRRHHGRSHRICVPTDHGRALFSRRTPTHFR